MLFHALCNHVLIVSIEGGMDIVWCICISEVSGLSHTNTNMG